MLGHCLRRWPDDIETLLDYVFYLLKCKRFPKAQVAERFRTLDQHKGPTPRIQRPIVNRDVLLC